MNAYRHILLSICFVAVATMGFCQEELVNISRKEAAEFQNLRGEKTLYVERKQYPPDHHNTGTVFLYGEVNQNPFTPGAAMIRKNLKY